MDTYLINVLVLKYTVPENANVASLDLSNGGAHLDQIAWMHG